MRRILPFLAVGSLLLLVETSAARQEALTAEQKQQMERIDRVLVEVLALSDKGVIDAGPLTEVVVRRLQEFGYTPVTDSGQPHDVAFKVKCEQEKPGKAARPWAAMPISRTHRLGSGKVRPVSWPIC